MGPNGSVCARRKVIAAVTLRSAPQLNGPTLMKMEVMPFSMDFVEMFSASAIALLDKPRAKCAKISVSREVRSFIPVLSPRLMKESTTLGSITDCPAFTSRRAPTSVAIEGSRSSNRNAIPDDPSRNTSRANPSQRSETTAIPSSGCNVFNRRRVSTATDVVTTWARTVTITASGSSVSVIQNRLSIRSVRPTTSTLGTRARSETSPSPIRTLSDAITTVSGSALVDTHSFPYANRSQ